MVRLRCTSPYLVYCWRWVELWIPIFIHHLHTTFGLVLHTCNSIPFAVFRSVVQYAGYHKHTHQRTVPLPHLPDHLHHITYTPFPTAFPGSHTRTRTIPHAHTPRTLHVWFCHGPHLPSPFGSPSGYILFGCGLTTFTDVYLRTQLLDLRLVL